MCERSVGLLIAGQYFENPRRQGGAQEDVHELQEQQPEHLNQPASQNHAYCIDPTRRGIRFASSKAMMTANPVDVREPSDIAEKCDTAPSAKQNQHRQRIATC